MFRCVRSATPYGRLSVLMVRLSAQNTTRGFGERLAGVRGTAVVRYRRVNTVTASWSPAAQFDTHGEDDIDTARVLHAADHRDQRFPGS